MKFYSLLLAIFFGLPGLDDLPKKVGLQIPGSLTIEITNLRSNKGQVGIALYNHEEGFAKSSGKAISVIYSAISANKSAATFADLPPGEYAVSICHDENSNKKLDTNFLGIPKEGVGASNNARGFLGPPKYKDAKFNFSGKLQTVTIKIIYL